jgi:hypothetical protein
MSGWRCLVWFNRADLEGDVLLLKDYLDELTLHGYIIETGVVVPDHITSYRHGVSFERVRCVSYEYGVSIIT